MRRSSTLRLEAASGAVTTDVQTPDLTIDKSHTGVLSAGRTAVFHLAVTNAGGASASGAVTLPYAFAVAAGAPANLASTASADGGRDGDPTNNTDTDVAGVVAQADLGLSCASTGIAAAPPSPSSSAASRSAQTGASAPPSRRRAASRSSTTAR